VCSPRSPSVRLPLSVRAPSRSSIWRPPGNRVYILNGDRNGYNIGAYDVESESFEWSDSFDVAGTGHFAGDLLVVSEDDGFDDAIRAFDIETGNERFSHEIEFSPDEYIVGEEILFAIYSGESATTTDGALVAYELQDGTEQYRNEPFESISTVTADDDHLYYWLDNEYRAMDAETGDTEWSYPMTDTVDEVIVGADALYLGQDERIFVVDAESGEEIATHEIDGIDMLRSVDKFTLSGDRLWAMANADIQGEHLVGFEFETVE